MKTERLRPAPARGAECIEGWARRRRLRSELGSNGQPIVCGCGHEAAEHSTGGGCMVEGCRCRETIVVRNP